MWSPMLNVFLPLGDRQTDVDVLRVHVSAQCFGYVQLRHDHRLGVAWVDGVCRGAHHSEEGASTMSGVSSSTASFYAMVDFVDR